MSELTEDELSAIKTIDDAATKAGLTGDPNDKGTPRGSLFALIGADTTTTITSLALISVDDFAATVRGWRISEVPVAGQPPVERPPTLMENGQALYVARIARLKLGIEGKPPATGTALPALPSPSASATTRKIKMSQILSQLDETEIELVSSVEQLKYFARYETLFGKGQRPRPEQEPSIEQLSGLKSLLDASQCPYADYAIFQPHAARIMKRIRFSGLVLNKAGALTQAEIFGPPDLDSWRSCHDVWANSMVMLDAIDLGALQAYKSRIEMLHIRYGEAKVWPLLYQADTRARLEHLPRKRLELLQEHQEALNAGNTTPFDPARPWNYAPNCVANDDKFWAHEFSEPAMIILSDTKGVRPGLDDDARVAQQPDESASLTATAAATRPRNANRTGRVHDLVDGVYKSNRTGHPLCSDFNQGKCTNTIQGTWCGNHQNRAHQCSRCLGTHSLTACPHQETPQPSWLKNAGRGRGRGRSRGKGKPKGSAPY
jgi:hypothetical protein